MPEISLNLSEALRKQGAAVLRSVSVQIRWKPGKAQPHLDKRIRLGHLPPDDPRCLLSRSKVFLAWADSGVLR